MREPQVNLHCRSTPGDPGDRVLGPRETRASDSRFRLRATSAPPAPIRGETEEGPLGGGGGGGVPGLGAEGDFQA